MEVNKDFEVDNGYDYQTWHLFTGKGKSYEDSFVRLPYRKMVWNWEKEVLENIVDKFSLSTSETKYLDFACGTGRLLDHFQMFSFNSYGVDVSTSMLRIARQKNKDSNLVQGNLTEGTIFPDEYFNLITAFRFFLNAQNDLRERVLLALGRIIKNDGILILNIHMNKGCLLEKVIRLYQRMRGFHDPYFNSISIHEMSNLLRKYHFEVKEIFHFGVLPIYHEEYKLFLDLINLLERQFSRYGFLRGVSRYIIYVCQYKPSLLP